MTASLLRLHTDKAAWALAETAPVSERLARQALIFAAEQTVIDSAWLTDERWTVLISRCMHAAVPAADRRSRFEWLVAAVSSQFGPLIACALDELVRP